jgi:type II secretory pathway component GspD/PulD (secretin)
VRKRIVIGAIAVVVIEVAAYLLWEPGRGTVEWHKGKYLAAVDVRWKHQWELLRSRLMREDGQRGIRFDVEGMKRHESALLRLGFLERREFVASNRPLDAVMSHVAGWAVRSPNEKFYRYTTPETNRVVIVAARDDMPNIERLVAESDVRETE